MDWGEARDLASSTVIEAYESVHLATITSPEEQAVINGLMEETTANGWLGCFQADDKLSIDENWQWITSEPFDFMN